MLEANDIPFTYREYRKQPLSVDELQQLMARLGMSPRQVLRTRDRAYGELGLRGDEDEAQLLRHMASHPTLLQRPIAVLEDKAVVGRPVERILDLVPDSN